CCSQQQLWHGEQSVLPTVTCVAACGGVVGSTGSAAFTWLTASKAPAASAIMNLFRKLSIEPPPGEITTDQRRPVLDARPWCRGLRAVPPTKTEVGFPLFGRSLQWNQGPATISRMSLRPS